MSGRFEQEQKTYRSLEYAMEDYPQIVIDFYRVLKAQGKTYSTIDNYMTAFMKFVNWCEHKPYPGYYVDNDFYKRVTSSMVMEYLDDCKWTYVNGTRKKLSSCPAHFAYCSIKLFFEWLEEEGKIDRTPVRESFCPKQNAQVRTVYLTEEEVAAVMQSINEKSAPYVRSRNLLFFAVGVTTGLRCSAILNIDISDIDFDSHTIEVVEKGDKTRTVILSNEVMRLLNEYLPDRKKYFSKAAKKTDALFVTSHGTRWANSNVNSMLKLVTEGVTEKNVTPHVLRHTCATILYDKTRDIYLVSSQLGHSQINTTQRYAAIFDESKQQAADILGSVISSK